MTGEGFRSLLFPFDTCLCVLVEFINYFKVGLFSSIYKNKGDKNDSKNHRGIVVIPILCKILEHIARNNFRTILTKQQSPLQRG
jgi:hypothetical protein